MKAADVKPNTIYRVGKKGDYRDLTFVKTTSKPIMERKYRSDRISHVNAYPITWEDGKLVVVKRMHVYERAHYSGTPGEKKRNHEVYTLQKIQPVEMLTWPDPVEGVCYTWGYKRTGYTDPVVENHSRTVDLAFLEEEYAKKRANGDACKAVSEDTDDSFRDRWEKINLATLELLGIFQPNPISYYEVWHSHNFDEQFKEHGFVDEIARDLKWDKDQGFKRDRVYINDLSIDTIEKINDLVNWKEDNAFL